MCCDTKDKIASTLRELMQEKPFQKITVQDIMSKAGMKRQSFYYHFQDIYDVLEWEVDRRLFSQLPDTNGCSCEEWLCSFLTLLDADRAFYRKFINAEGRSKTVAMCNTYVRPLAKRLVLPEESAHRQLTDEETFAADFVTYALVNYLIDDILGKDPLDNERSRKRLMVSFRTAACFRPQAPGTGKLLKFGQPA